jgi:hypothetical protein
MGAFWRWFFDFFAFFDLKGQRARGNPPSTRS